MYWALRLRFAAHLELDATLVAPQQKAATRGMTNAPIAPTPVPYRYCNTKGIFVCLLLLQKGGTSRSAILTRFRVLYAEHAYRS